MWGPKNYRSVLIFGGSGFVGSHLVKSYLKAGIKVTVVDLVEPTFSGDYSFISGDVRQELNLLLEETPDLVINAAAVHRTPGHAAHEYYETNLLGALNIIKWSESNNIDNIVFLSSISIYGLGESVLNENSSPKPVSDYGISKLLAEKMFINWATALSTKRRLVICRPAVIFGPGEKGNMTRLAEGIRRRYFFFPSSKPIVKASCYVEEVFSAIQYVLTLEESISVFNLTFPEPYTVQEYAKVICANGKYRFPMTFNVTMLARTLSRAPGSVGTLFKRISKLDFPTNIPSSYLKDNGYEWSFTLEEAFKRWWEISGFDLATSNSEKS